MNTEYYKYTGDGDSYFDRLGEIIRRGGLVAFPTETVYGLGVSALNGESVPKVFAAKGRPSDNPLIVHIAYPEDAESLSYTSDEYYRLAERFMPGPLTVILPKKDCVPYEVTGGLDSVGIRCPSHPAAHRLILASGVPIAAPSANISGAPSPTLGEHVMRDMDGKIDALLDAGSSDFGLESTVIALRDNSAEILRPGAVTREDLLEVLREVTVSPAVKDPASAGDRPTSPGMKYKHYSPCCEFILVDADGGGFAEYVNSFGKHCGVICRESEKDSFCCDFKYTYPDKDPARELCHRLFAIFRKADDDGADRIFARLPGDTGEELALYNRMIRAAGGKVTSLSA